MPTTPNTQTLNHDTLTAEVSQLIRRPPEVVFSAFVEPESLTQFWLSKASGPLEQGKTIQWEFMVPGAKVETRVTHLESPHRISIAWSDGTTVDWQFQPHAEGTLVHIRNTGFQGTREERIQNALESTQGFTLVLSDAKLWLETGASPHLVRDKALLIEENLTSTKAEG